EDLRTAKAAIAGGGFTLMGEAVHLGVPMLSVPVERQFEQILNAQYLQDLGYGAWTDELRTETIGEFLAKTDDYAHSLERYPRQDNQMTYAVIDELIRHAALGEPAPDALDVRAMGHYERKDWIDEHLLDELEVREAL
ncbi:MAG: glycosyltransferase family protein, partial [Myxococcota bacterium]